MDPFLAKLGALVLLQQVIGVSKELTTRWIIKNWFSTGEITAFSWLSLEFLGSPLKILGLCIIAAFTLVTFPIGIWIGSFKLGLSSGVSTMVTGAVSLVVTPLNFFAINKALGEMVLSRYSVVGLLFMEAAVLLAIAGGYLIYLANQGAL